MDTLTAGMESAPTTTPPTPPPVQVLSFAEPLPGFPGYAPVVPAAVRGELGLGEAADARVFCLVSVPDGNAAEATANLRAPVVVASATGRARQVVQSDAAHPLRRRLRR